MESREGWWRFALAALHLEIQMGVLRLENAHQLRATMNWVRAEVRTRRIAPIGATLPDQKIALNADFYVSMLAANTENTQGCIVSPHFIRPCIPMTAKAIPRGDAWLHEPKLDGYRFQIVKDGRQVKLYSRSGYDWTKRLPAFAETLRALPCHSAVLDGELCLPGPGGAPDFRGLQGALRSRGDELAVFVFDLLRRDEDDLTDMPLSMRKQLLMRLIGRDFPCLQPVQTFEDGAKLLAAAERHGLEGIVSKRRASAYRSGPSSDWVKTKTAAWRVANRDRWKAFQQKR